MGDLGVTHRVYLWLDGKCVVDFLLAIIEFFSIALTAAVLLSEICRNRRFPTGVGHFERKLMMMMSRFIKRVINSPQTRSLDKPNR